MITAFVTVTLPPDLTREKWLENTKNIAARFQGVPGLVRKNFIFNRDTGLGGGVYTWQSREIAEKFHAGPWRDNIIRMFGVEPQIQYFDSPVIVDNVMNRIELTD
jgi:hypothetical protein